MEYQHFTMGEREQLAGFLGMNMRIRAIATAMKRHPSTIARERSRGTIDGVYSATDAAKAAKTRRKNSGSKGRYSFSMAMNISALLRCTWSPEQIDGYCWLHGIPMASFKTIYRWLYAGKLFRYQAGQKNVLNTRVLRQKGMRSGSSMREVIAATGDSIHNRPPEVENRSEFGHWEADTVVSPRGVRGACVATFLERQTRQFFAIQMPNRTAAAMNTAIQTFVDSLPAGAVRSLSVDRGKEFATYTSVTKALQIKLYFADPYSSWQRGSIENHNGLLREFYPKETDFTSVSNQQLSSAVALINCRPRKCHQWRSTSQLFLTALSQLK